MSGLPHRQQALGRIEELANQLGVSTQTVKVGGAVVAAAGFVYANSGRSPVQLDLPPKNAEDTKPIYETGKKHWTCDPKGEAYIPLAKTGPGSEKDNPLMTVPALLEIVLTR